MLRYPRPRAAGLRVAIVLAAVVLGMLPLGSAVGVGTGDPTISSPSGTQPLYEGFTGPYRVDFSNAPAALYTYRVERTPVGEVPVEVDSGTFTSTTGTEIVPFTLAALDPAQAYRFVIEDETGDHRNAVTFEVRAGAQPRCSVVVPSSLRVNSAEEVVYGRRAADCTAAHITRALWDVTNLSRGTNVNSLAFYDNFKDFWKFFDGQPLGLYVMKAREAVNAADDAILQNQPRTEVRLDARFSFSATRDGSYVTLRASLRKYSRTANAFGPWGKHAVALSYRTCSSCGWTHFQTVTTTLSGAASYRFRAPTARTYRVTSGGTSTYWAPYPHYDRA